MNNKMIEEFVKRYSITRVEYTRAKDYSRYDYSNTASAQVGYSSIIREQNVDIEIPSRAFEYLVEMDNRAEGEYRAGREEAKIRARYPAVAEAYNQYEMLLSLCK